MGGQPFFPQKGPSRRFPRRGLERLAIPSPGKEGREGGRERWVGRS